ncbi:DUF4214 domain-containing protein [Devosia sp. FJ2-5-3]|uniref:DUF4214 domain-containing protein n=1 Tax=Devosia sp. FJ2-5-3 TaxID=2976680 RepID=UPI0023D8923A|nr:DUF4214 domain-containing protein [Devosia sp. FJ2-5-3]WEJ58110.1 DUF4214 domain-containing protein [Devosia sp. FJ2-5-3]
MSAAIQGIYIALFGRPADPGGLAYWTEVTKGGADLSAMLSVLPNLTEYTARFEGQTPDQVITTVYQNLFGRAPDAEGLAFFKGQLASGAQTLATIAVNIMQGAQGDDKADVTAKVSAAELFTASLDTPEEIAAYQGADAAALAKKFLDTVDKDKPATPESVEKAAGAVVAGQDPTGGQAPNPGGGTGGTPDPVPHYDTDYVDMLGANIGGKLFAGKGNSAAGFAVAVNDKAGIELGLDVRYRNDPTDIAPGTPDNLARANDLRFAYSVAQEGGIDLQKYTYKLEIDIDASAAQEWVTFELRADQTPGMGNNNSNSQFDWVQVDSNGNAVGGGKSIADDGGNAAVSQNIQALHWYTGKELIQDGGLYDIKLTATNKLGQIEAQNVIQLNPVLPENYSTVTRGAVADLNGNLFVGSGNTASGFNVVTLANGIELGLGGRYAYGDTRNVELTPDGPVINIGSLDSARLAYSVAGVTADTLNDFVIRLKIDTNAGDGSDFIILQLAANGRENGGNSFGVVNSGGNSHFVWKAATDISFSSNQLPGPINIPKGQNAITDDGGNESVTQNILAPGWFDELPNTSAWQPGKYDVILEVVSKDHYGNEVAVVGQNHVVYNVANIIPE